MPAAKLSFDDELEQVLSAAGGQIPTTISAEMIPMNALTKRFIPAAQLAVLCPGPTMRSLTVLMAAALVAGCDHRPPDTAGPENAMPTPSAAAVSAALRPNFLVILADDLGYTDLGVFGSEIRTPNIDRLAANGLVLTNYYTSPICAPTRAELLSGTDHRLAGQGMMQVNIAGTVGYEGRLSERVISLATRLRDAGYFTAMTH